MNQTLGGENAHKGEDTHKGDALKAPEERLLIARRFSAG